MSKIATITSMVRPYHIPLAVQIIKKDLACRDVCRSVTTPSGSRAEGARRVTPVCRPTPSGRFHTRKPRTASSATHALHGTTNARGSIFTPGPKPVKLPKRSLVANVHKNCMSFLFERNTSGHVDSTPLHIRNAAFNSMQIRLERIAVQVCNVSLDSQMLLQHPEPEVPDVHAWGGMASP
jgi:hypothetical protein